MKIGYTSKEVCKITGISYRQLDYWDSSGFIQPSVAKAKGGILSPSGFHGWRCPSILLSILCV
ncbi:MerR family DNA-binding transcriptional regulator [Candidatus Poribacteria bacterium]